MKLTKTRQKVVIWDKNNDLQHGVFLSDNKYAIYQDKYKSWVIVEVEAMNPYAVKVVNQIYWATVQADALFCASKKMEVNQ